MLPLHTQLRSIKRRWYILGLATGLIGATVVAILFLLLGGWLDLVWELSPQGRIGFIIAAALLGLVFLAVSLIRTGQSGRLFSLAQRVDRAMGFGGAVLTGCELEQTYRSKTGQTAAMAQMAVEHAAKLAAQAVPAQAVSAKQVRHRAIVLVSLLGLIGLLVLTMPGMMKTQWNRFAHPYGDIPRFSNTIIEIEAPEKQVVYGEPLDIRAVVHGDPVDSATLILETADSNVETLSMFPEANASWRASLARVTEDAIYYIRAGHSRSTRHTIEVIMVPRIENVRFRIIPPSYTHLTVYEGPLPSEGISGLSGTRVEVRATSNRPLSRGEITLTMGQNNPVVAVNMLPTTTDSTEVLGEFEITDHGRFELQLFDVEDLGSRDRVSGSITLLRDERPMIRIMQPPARSLATPSVTLPVILYAEDDYGIAQIQIFRSLNDSRFMPSDIPLPPRESTSPTLRKFHGQVDLPLRDYEVQPGDTIKIFARVLDNDPAGAKGAESSVVIIEIISQEEFEQMTLARQGLEAMLSRYREALRRLEAAKEEVEKLLEKLQKLDPDDPISDEIKQELQKLAERMRRETEAIRRLAQNPLPYELDKQLSEELAKAAKLTEDAAESIDKMLDEAMSNEDARERLEKLSKQLGAGKQAFDQATMPSLELLAAIMPLKMAENRFIELVRWQRDLADRLSSLSGQDQVVDPAIRARMQELEEEQRQIEEALHTLLKDIVEHANMLPEREEFERLRETALDFASAVRHSGATPAMIVAQSALGEYLGTLGHANAEEAAKTLEQFLSQCEGMGQCASDCLSFSPSMGNCLSETLAQLLRNMGFGSGTGSGGGFGAGYGMNSMRGGPNVGLYGMLPGMGTFANRQDGRQSGAQGSGRGGGADGMNPDFDEGFEASAEGTVGGASEGIIPLRYRQAVGRYFQRIVENE
ncbi:MAG: hypothetical protein FWE95_08415 [Planctomycetaceae bacterium]|nr:hypothetical protein [Planctomycetaceae bacterium]